jgi:hypothetical protein
MDRDRRAELSEHIDACYARLAVETNPSERETIHYVIEHLEAQLAQVRLPAIWEKIGPAFRATVTGPEDQRTFHMTVEQAVEGHWRFSVWRPGDPWQWTVSGIAPSAEEAMRRAELATT